MAKHPKRFSEDGIELKFCGRCEEWKPKTLEFFYFRKSRNAWENPCRACGREYAKQWVSENPIAPEAQRAATIKYKYGITLDEYDAMVKRQGGLCAVCKRPPSGRNKHLSVDHCHKTGAVRGLLCYKCNTAAGLLGDDPELAAQLTLYLEGAD
jgi:Recombination endonuclease VII